MNGDFEWIDYVRKYTLPIKLSMNAIDQNILLSASRVHRMSNDKCDKCAKVCVVNNYQFINLVFFTFCTDCVEKCLAHKQLRAVYKCAISVTTYNTVSTEYIMFERGWKLTTSEIRHLITIALSMRCIGLLDDVMELIVETALDIVLDR